MKSLLKFMGTVLGFFLLLMALALGMLEVRSRGFDAESRRFAREVGAAILAGGQLETLEAYAAPALLETQPDPRLAELFTMLDTLGALRQVHDCEGQSYISFGNTADGVITAYYELAADYEGGTAWIRMRLARIERRWRILGFQGVADAFAGAQPGAGAPGAETQTTPTGRPSSPSG
jgi:hypothetical protein